MTYRIEESPLGTFSLPHGNNHEPLIAYSMDAMGNRLFGFDPPTGKEFEQLLAASRKNKQ